MQELEERVANVRERGRILTDFLYSMGNGNASPSSGGAQPRRPHSSPRFRCTMSRGSPGGGGTVRPPSVPGRLMSRLGPRGASASPAPHGQGLTNAAADAADDPRQRLSPPLARTSDYVEHTHNCIVRMPSQRASQRASQCAREEEDQLAAARLASEEEDHSALTLASEEERQLAAAIQASLTESDKNDGTAPQGASRPTTAWGSPSVARPPSTSTSTSTSTSRGENFVDFPAALAGGGDFSPGFERSPSLNNGYV